VEVRAAFQGARAGVGKGAGELKRTIGALDPTLRATVDAYQGQSFALLQEIERKLMQSLKRENETAFAQVAKAQLHLFPLGKPQERVLNPFYYLMRYDEGFLSWVRRETHEAVLPRLDAET
jgi:bacillithiol synthase